jgi:ribosomal protein L37E
MRRESGAARGPAPSSPASAATPPPTVAHWWCRRCGRWEVCDDADFCIECGYMVAARSRRRPRRPRSLTDDGASEARA